MRASLKQRLHSDELIVGTFVKTPSPIIVDVLALTGLDCLCLDAEHAPFDRSAIDLCVMAARTRGMDVVVRVPSQSAEHILNALDCGATGVIVPHIRSANEARSVVQASHYGAGGRGYAGSSRAAGYTTRTMADHLRRSAEETVIILQIEDLEPITAIDEIAAVAGIDALFIGRVDLTVAIGASSQDDPIVVAAAETVCEAAVAAGCPVGMFLSRIEDVALWRDRGMRLFLLGSDHGFLLQGAEALVARARV